jgi:hypothetical protein
MVRKLDVNEFDKDRPLVIGEMTAALISLINANCKQPLIGTLSETQIIMWEDRISHTENHAPQFSSRDEYDKAFENIPLIISDPDFVGIHPDGGSVQFIKKLGDLLLVAVRISNNGKLSYRTMYPITEGQLNDYVKKGRAWHVP